MKKLAVLLSAVLIAAAATAGEYKNISVDELKSAIESKKVAVIDANGTESWQKARIPGAINYETQKDNLAKVLPKDKDTLVVAYCGGPQCSAYKAAAKAAKDLGYNNVKYLSAGISGWKQTGQKVEKGG